MTSNATVNDLFEPVLTLAELADYLHVPAQTLYDLRAKGRGPRGFRVGRCLHFRKSEIEAWLAGLEGEDERQEPARSRP
jgi:excisionase family DNA binding protein